MKDRLLVVDDEPGIQLAVSGFMEARGYQVKTAGGALAAREAFRQNRFDAVILDYVLPDGDALELLREFQEEDPNLPVVLLTGHGSIDLAVQAMKQGAEHFLTKPVELKALEVVLERALEGRRIRRHYLASQLERGDEADPFLGASLAIRRLEEEARIALRADSPILIQGDTGAGKGVLARWLHRNGRRAEHAFVDLNCAGLSTQLLDSELFGHERGAFTGAVAQKKGLLEVADRGVLFLDEIGDTEPAIQAKLLKVVEEQRFRRLGSVRDQRVDIQLIAATNQDLRQACSEERFRRDLYFRISGLVLRVPPLRERRDDIPLLALALLENLAKTLGQAAKQLSPEAQQRLQGYSWPGNIRELRNVLERAVLVCPDRAIQPHHLRLDWIEDSPRPAAETPTVDTGTLDDLERREIERALSASRGVVKEAAEVLGVSRSTLYSKLRLYNLDLDDFRPG